MFWSVTVSDQQSMKLISLFVFDLFGSFCLIFFAFSVERLIFIVERLFKNCHVSLILVDAVPA
jgi:hypothetical protein